jgi:hypothetical protein
LLRGGEEGKTRGLVSASSSVLIVILLRISLVLEDLEALALFLDIVLGAIL